MARTPSFKETIARAYKSTPVYKLDKLLKEEKQWRRKQTIATNKLAKVRKAINKFAAELAHEQVNGATAK